MKINIQYDKLLHFTASLLIVLLLYPFIGWLGMVVAALAGIGKELYDKHDYGLFSFPDLLADGIGIAVGTLILNLIHTLS